MSRHRSLFGLVGSLMLMAPLALAQDHTVWCVSSVLPNQQMLVATGPVELDWVVPGTLIESTDGSACLGGTVCIAGVPAHSFRLNILLGGRVDPGDPAYPPAGSPHILDPSAPFYSWNGGPVEPARWRYYTSMTGSLIGQEQLAGAVVELARYGPAFQFGLGAGEVGPENTGAGWVSYVIHQPPTGGWPTLPVMPNPTMPNPKMDMALLLGESYASIEAHPGSGQDLRLATGINAVQPTTGIGQDVKSARVGDLVHLEVLSAGQFTGQDVLLLARSFDSRMLPPVCVEGFPHLYVDPARAMLVPPAPGGAMTMSAGIVSYAFQVPPSFAGSVWLFQAVALTGTGAGYVASEGHRIRMF